MPESKAVKPTPVRPSTVQPLGKKGDATLYFQRHWQVFQNQIHSVK